MSDDTKLNKFYDLFKEELITYFKDFETEKEKAIPIVLTKIINNLLPQVLKEINISEKKLSNEEKKQLAKEIIIFSIEKLFEELNLGTNLSKETWDDYVKEVLISMVPASIDLFLSIERKQTVFNKKRNSMCF